MFKIEYLSVLRRCRKCNKVFGCVFEGFPIVCTEQCIFSSNGKCPKGEAKKEVKTFCPDCFKSSRENKKGVVS